MPVINNVLSCWMWRNILQCQRYYEPFNTFSSEERWFFLYKLILSQTKVVYEIYMILEIIIMLESSKDAILLLRESFYMNQFLLFGVSLNDVWLIKCGGK